MDAESSTANPKSGAISRWWLHALLAFPILYVLSIGPVIKLIGLGALPSDSVMIYWPLGALCQYFEPLGTFIDWYVKEVWRAY